MNMATLIQPLNFNSVHVRTPEETLINSEHVCTPGEKFHAPTSESTHNHLQQLRPVFKVS